MVQLKFVQSIHRTRPLKCCRSKPKEKSSVQVQHIDWNEIDRLTSTAMYTLSAWGQWLESLSHWINMLRLHIIRLAVTFFIQEAYSSNYGLWRHALKPSKWTLANMVWVDEQVTVKYNDGVDHLSRRYNWPCMATVNLLRRMHVINTILPLKGVTRLCEVLCYQQNKVFPLLKKQDPQEDFFNNLFKSNRILLHSNKKWLKHLKTQLSSGHTRDSLSLFSFFLSLHLFRIHLWRSNV